MIKEILDSVYQVMDWIFWPLFHISSNPKFNAILGVMLISLLISVIIVGITSKIVDQKRMKKLKAKTAKYQETIKKAQKRKNMKKVSSIQKEMMKNQKEMMGMSMKPMMYTMIPIIVIFTWLSQYDFLNDFITQQGYLIALPFTLPKFGATLGWLGWYILCSLPMSVLIKKILKIEGP
tara:strand:- start:209 stop:742 length:534 start_codon:yes stop_codon:yes gene_type:complete